MALTQALSRWRGRGIKDEIDIEGVLGFAEHALAQPARLWSESSLDQRQRLQKVRFPHGVTYSPEGDLEPPKPQ